MSQNVRTQNLRDFTVQIRNVETDITVGTGIAVSNDGKIVTCAHVVESAGVDPCVVDGKEVGIYFPQARGGEQKKRRAKLAACFAIYDDDMVLLQLDSAPPLSPEQIAVLGTADGSELNIFMSYGYSPIGNYPASRADGKILGSVEPPKDRNLRVDPIQLKSRQIAPGMSGAAVLDVERNLVVGLVAERYFPKDTVQDDISYSADAKILTFPPFDFTLRGDALDLRPAPTVKLEEALIREAFEIARNALADRSEADKISWHYAHAVLDEFTGREAFLAQINNDWNEPKKHVTGLIGFGGEGKSSLARKWVDDLLNDPNQTQPDGIFWWGFYENRSVDEFFEAALEYMSSGQIEPQKMPLASIRAQVIASMLGSGRYLFVLDGLEVMQHQEGDQYGLLQSNDLRDFLAYFAAPDHESFCLVTSRAPLLDLMEYTTYTHHNVTRLLLKDGIALLRRLGVNGNDDELGQIIAQWDGHALMVSLLGSYLVEKFDGDIAHLDDIPTPTADEPRFERVHRILRRYDEHLTEPEREFLKLFSAFRMPLHEDALDEIVESLLGVKATRQNKTESVLKKLFKRKKAAIDIDGSPLHKITSRLVTYRLLRHDAETHTYTAHPLILVALAVFVLVGFTGVTGLTIDGGNVFADRRHAQNAADTAAYAAALAKVRGGDWQSDGLARAADNDYFNDGTNIVQVVSPPISGTYAGNPDYIQVLITSHVDTYISRVVGKNQMTNQVQAIARTKLSDIGPLFDGQALVALKKTGTTFTTCDNPNVNVTNSGIFVNSSSSCAMQSGGNIYMHVDNTYSIVNASDPLCTDGNVTVDGPVVGGAEQIEYPPRIDLPAPSIECTGNGYLDGNTYQPGNYNGLTVDGGTINFAPGNYCFDGNVRFNGGDITANYVSFRLNDGDFSLNGNATLTADHMIVFSTGTADGVHFNGTGDITATNITFYLESGDVEWNGNADNTLTAPTTGPNAGMLIYLPYGNNAELKINGNADSLIQGTILAVSSHIKVTSNSGTNSINSQIVGYTVEACGNGDLNISWDPGDNYQQQEPAKIELIK